MKKTFSTYATLLLLVLVCSCNSAEKKKTAKIYGKFNTEEKSMPLVYDGAASAFSNSRNIDVAGDSEGNFSVEVPLDKPTFFRFKRNTIYLSPGDDLKMIVNENSEDATFEGTSTEINNYMRGRLFPHGGSFLKAGQVDIRDADSLIEYTKAEAAKRLAELNALKDASKEFVELETARVYGDMIKTYTMFTSYNKDFYSIKSREERQEKYKEAMNILNPEIIKEFAKINKGKFLDVAVVRSVLFYINRNLDSLEGITLNPDFKEFLEVSKKLGVLRKPTPENIKEIKEYITTVKSEDFKDALNDKIAQVSRLLKGSPAIDFELEDITGKKVKLSDYKGKYIYLDFWATWCGPCKYEAPFFEKLNQEIDNDDILFISVSVDSSTKAWKEYLAKHDKKTLQLHSTDKVIYNDWQVNGIPRFILIDKDFNIIKSNADRPSTKEAKEMLSNLK